MGSSDQEDNKTSRVVDSITSCAALDSGIGGLFLGCTGALIGGIGGSLVGYCFSEYFPDPPKFRLPDLYPRPQYGSCSWRILFRCEVVRSWGSLAGRNRWIRGRIFSAWRGNWSIQNFMAWKQCCNYNEQTLWKLPADAKSVGYATRYQGTIHAIRLPDNGTNVLKIHY